MREKREGEYVREGYRESAKRRVKCRGTDSGRKRGCVERRYCRGDEGNVTKERGH